MHDLNFIRKNEDSVKENLNRRGLSVDSIDSLLRLDLQRRDLVKTLEINRATVNKQSSEIGRLLKAGHVVEAEELKSLVKQTLEKNRDYEAQHGRVEVEMKSSLERLPNLLHESVPFGLDSNQNQEVRRWGVPKNFDFDPLPHWEIAHKLGILDIDRAAKLTGTRFAVYKGIGAKLERALASFMLDIHTKENEYTEILPPFVVNSQSLFGTGNLPKFESELYKLNETDYWLIPTAEVPLTCLYRDEILPPSSLPIKLTAWTPCFRREAGSHGRDVRGILRQHQFQKVELVKLVRPEHSYAELEGLVKDAEKILQRLEIPYRVVLLCSGDTGFASSKTYDIEAYLPGQKAYREISSCSNCGAFQARRANIRFRSHPAAKPEFVHTLNGSGLAIGRTWLAILENYQQRDGSVIIPDALSPYLDGVRILSPS